METLYQRMIRQIALIFSTAALTSALHHALPSSLGGSDEGRESGSSSFLETIIVFFIVLIGGFILVIGKGVVWMMVFAISRMLYALGLEENFENRWKINGFGNLLLDFPLFGAVASIVGTIATAAGVMIYNWCEITFDKTGEPHLIYSDVILPTVSEPTQYEFVNFLISGIFMDVSDPYSTWNLVRFGVLAIVFLMFFRGHSGFSKEDFESCEKAYGRKLNMTFEIGGSYFTSYDAFIEVHSDILFAVKPPRPDRRQRKIIKQQKFAKKIAEQERKAAEAARSKRLPLP